jgi:hypothetical protein
MYIHCRVHKILLQGYILRKTGSGHRKVNFDISCQHLLGLVFRFPDQINLRTTSLNVDLGTVYGTLIVPCFWTSVHRMVVNAFRVTTLKNFFPRMQYLEFKTQCQRKVFHYSITTDLFILIT